MQMRTLAVVAILFGHPALGAGANPGQVEEIVRRSVANTNADWAEAPRYDFTEQDTIVKNGKRITKTYEVVMIDGSPYNNPAGEDGKLQQEIERRYEFKNG